MIELITEFLHSLYFELANPQKRVFIGYLGSALIIALMWLCFIEKFSFKIAVKRIFDRSVWLSRSSITDFKLLLLNRIILSASAGAIISQLTISTIIYEALHKQTFVPPLAFHSLSENWIAALFTVCFFVIDDFARFFVHRLMHKVPFLWAFHQVHHSAEKLTPFTIFRTHPVEGIIFLLRTSIVQGISISVFLFLFGNKVDLITIYGASVGVVLFHSLGSNLRHSHIKIRYPKILECILISPGQHQIHHSTEHRHFDKNFGVAFAIWDLIFGSLEFSDNKNYRFGLDTKFGEKQTLKHLYLEPFKSAFKTIRKPSTKKAPKGGYKNENHQIL